MALIGIGSLKHHILTTKRVGFIFIFIVQTIKPGVDVKQHTFDMRKCQKQNQIGSMRPGLMLLGAPWLRYDKPKVRMNWCRHIGMVFMFGLQKLIFFLMILLWPQSWVHVLYSPNHRRLTASWQGTGRGSFAAFSGFLREDGPSLNGTHVPKSVSLSPTSLFCLSASPKTSLSAASCFSNSARAETVERGK